MTRLHFISGLQRSGSTLLASILNQNPGFRAGMSSPVFPIFNAALSAMGGGNEFAVFLQDDQKRRILNGILDGYHGGPEAAPVAFDTNRMWTSRLPALIALRPEVKVIACVRNPAWILDSIEVLLRRNALDTTRLFGTDAERMSVFARADALSGRTRLIGGAYLAFKEAFYSREARSMLILDYDTLVRHPGDAMTLVYQFLGEPHFIHDFNDVHFQAEDFDGFLMARDLHTVKGRVEPRTRATVRPPDLFRRFEQWISGRRAKVWPTASPRRNLRPRALEPALHTLSRTRRVTCRSQGGRSKHSPPGLRQACLVGCSESRGGFRNRPSRQAWQSNRTSLARAPAGRGRKRQYRHRCWARSRTRSASVTEQARLSTGPTCGKSDPGQPAPAPWAMPPSGLRAG